MVARVAQVIAAIGQELETEGLAVATIWCVVVSVAQGCSSPVGSSSDGGMLSCPQRENRKPRPVCSRASCGPWLAIVPGIIALRAPAMGALVSDFFKSDLFVWSAGALLVFGAC